MGRDCDREVGVIKTNSAYWVECMKTELQVLELREKELRVLDRLKEEEYCEYVTKTGCKIRSWHMTTLSLKWQIKVEEAQRDSFLSDHLALRIILAENIKERDSVRFLIQR
jgi:hypothetical protein